MLNRQIFKATSTKLAPFLSVLWPEDESINAFSPWFTVAECLLYEDTSAEDCTPNRICTEECLAI